MSGEESGNPKSVEQDYRRMEDYNRQGWCMVGVYATAQVVIASGAVQTIRSVGLWGIESDSGSDYFDEVEGYELSNLREQLEALGFNQRQVSKAFGDVKRSG